MPDMLVTLGMLFISIRTIRADSYTLCGAGPPQGKFCLKELLSLYRTKLQRDITTCYQDNQNASRLLLQMSSSNAFDNGKGPITFGIQFGKTPSSLFKTYPSMVSIPLFASPVVFVYNFQTAPKLNLRLTPSQFISIFTREFTMWDDPSMASAGIDLPTSPINVWVRSDMDVDTTLVKHLMCKYNKSQPNDQPEFTGERFWINNTNYNIANSSYGVLAGVATKDNSIGYSDFDDYNANKEDGTLFKVALISNAAGTIVDPALDNSVMESINNQNFDVNFQGEILFPTGTNSYPIGNYLFMYFWKKSPSDSLPIDCATQAEFVRFLNWTFTNPGAKLLISGYSYTPMPESVYDVIVQKILKKMKCGPRDASSVWTVLLDQIAAENATSNTIAIVLAVLFGVPIILLLLGLLCKHVYGNMIVARKTQQQMYLVTDDQIKIIKASKEKYECMMLFRRYMEGRNSKPIFVVGEYRAEVVMLRRVPAVLTQIPHQARYRLVQLMLMIKHDNLVQLYGLTELGAFNGMCFTISQFCPLGDLRTALDNKRNDLDAPIRFGMAKGIAEGLTFLHNNGIVHGNLRSTIIYLEANWTTKISDWEQTEIDLVLGKFRNLERIWRRNLTPEEELIYLPALLWSAPEILAAVAKDDVYRPTKPCDVYSFSIIFFEILTRDLPYEYQNVPHSMSFEHLFAMIRRSTSPLRPLDFKEQEEITQNIPQSVVHIMKTGWASDPLGRPLLSEIRDILDVVSSEMKRLADLTIVNTLAQIEQYKRNIIRNSQETVELIKELEMTQMDFLTRWVYETELEGGIVPPKLHQVAYVMYCSLVNYEGLCTMAHGDAVLYFVDRFYHIVDKVLPPDRNIHRLHSNGDDVTIIGAIPTGGIEYAAKLASVALDLLVGIWSVDLLDIDWGRMEVRIGLSCGPVLACVYGNNHREFTVVGTAVDEAQMTESVGSAYQILVTEAFYEALRIYPDFTMHENLDDRNSLGSNRKTFWLMRKDNYANQTKLDEIAATYPLALEGRIPESDDKSVRVTRRRQQDRQITKFSVPGRGSFVHSDPRSGYVIEHHERVDEDPSQLSIVREAQEEMEKKNAQQAARNRMINVSQSKIFGSMLGPHGFTTYKSQYAVLRKERRAQLNNIFDTKVHFAGQLGHRKLHLTEPDALKRRRSSDASWHREYGLHADERSKEEENIKEEPEPTTNDESDPYNPNDDKSLRKSTNELVSQHHPWKATHRMSRTKRNLRAKNEKGRGLDSH